MFSTCQRSRSPSTDHREPQRDGTAAALRVRSGRGLARGLQDARRDVAGVVELMPARGERGSPARRCASRSAITGSRPWCHGFRSSFRDWAAEETDHHREVIEAALAHGVRNQAEAAYARSDVFERRRHLMADWAACGLVSIHAESGPCYEGHRYVPRSPPSSLLYTGSRHCTSDGISSCASG